MTADAPALVVASDAAAVLRYGGRAAVDRAVEALVRAGFRVAGVVAAPAVRDRVAAALAHRPGLGVWVPGEPALAAAVADAGEVVLVDASVLLDPRLLVEAASWRRPTQLVDRGQPVGVARVPAARLDPAALPDVAAAVAPDDARVDIDDLPRYSRALRRELRPYWLRVRTSTDVRRARRLLAAAGGKGHMEWWVLLVNRPVETWLSYHVTEWRVTPNQITFASNVAAVAAAVAFATGRLWLGLAAALANSILDGLDGRQARVQLKTSKVGELEHVFDALSEIAWVGALAWHLSGGLADAAIGWGALLWLAAYAADNAAYTFFRVRRGMMIDEASRIDAAVRFVGARRNTNFAYFAAALALGAPRVGFWIIAVGTAVTAAVHWLRVAVLLARPARAAAAVVDR